MSLFEGAQAISVYTREQAIQDGSLIDLGELAQEAGFRVPVAMTREAWAEVVAWEPTNKGLQDETGRAWDVVWMLRQAANSPRNLRADQFLYRLLRVPNKPKATKATLATLKAVIGPGDAGEPVVTLMLPHED